MNNLRISVFLALFVAAVLCGSSAFGQGWADTAEETKEQAGTDLNPRLNLPRLEKVIDPDEYILGPYDQILVNLVGPESRSFPLIVLPEGYVFVPGVGAIHADGLTLTRFREELEKEMGRFFRNIRVYCYLQQPRVFRVFVTGEVEKPGAVQVSSVQRISDAIELAGSIKSKGSNRRVILYRGGKDIEVDILKFVLEGDFSSNPFLSNGDRIHVPIAQKHAVIRGSVHRPAAFEVLPEETVQDLLALAGGFTGEAVSDTILLSRVEDDGSVSTTQLNRSVLGEVPLKDRDEINVMDCMTRTSRVYVFGATVNTGHYFITEGEGLTELLARIGSFKPDVDFSGASIERKSGEVIRLDLKDYLPPSPIRQMELRNGDMLHIPEISRMIAVGGEVQLPGKFPYEGDWTVAQYIGLAGGPTNEGSMDRVVIYSPDGFFRKADGQIRPNRGDVIIVKKSKSTLFGNFFSNLVTMGTVVISILVLTE